MTNSGKTIAARKNKDNMCFSLSLESLLLASSRVIPTPSENPEVILLRILYSYYTNNV